MSYCLPSSIHYTSPPILGTSTQHKLPDKCSSTSVILTFVLIITSLFVCHPVNDFSSHLLFIFGPLNIYSCYFSPSPTKRVYRILSFSWSYTFYTLLYNRLLQFFIVYSFLSNGGRGHHGTPILHFLTLF